MAASIVFWRCKRCGRWSHAQRRPTSHVRYLPEYHPDLRGVPDEDLLDEVANGMEQDTGATIYSIKFRCGPFRRWIAEEAE